MNKPKTPIPATIFTEELGNGEKLISLSLAVKVEDQKLLADAHHDLRASMHALGQFLKLLKHGYRFQDRRGEAFVNSFEQAVNILIPEVSRLDRLYSRARHETESGKPKTGPTPSPIPYP